MILLPSALLWMWALGLLALAMLAFGLWLVWRGLRPRTFIRVDDRSERLGHPQASLERGRPLLPVSLMVGIVLLLWSFAGSWIVLWAHSGGADEPRPLRSDRSQSIQRPDGTTIHIETFGNPNGPTLVLTHGWGFDNDEWYYAKRQLSGQFRLVTWDLRGLGQSSEPGNNDYALERMAEDLDAVVQQAGPGPVVLVGHSIGGMINLTYAKLFPANLGTRVAGIAELNTTYTDPAKTTSNAERAQSMQNSIGEPLLHVTAALSPAVRALNWLAYQSGLTHLHTARSSFAGTETRGQLDFASRYNVKSSPRVVALGTLAMLHWDATDVLPRVSVPVLLIAGDQDSTTTPDASQRMKQVLPTSQLVIMRPAKHLGPLERNIEYNRAIADFATSCLPGGAPQR